MKRFKVLEVDNVWSCKNKQYIQSCVGSCVVEDLETGEIINVDEKTASGLRAEIIDKIDNYDLVIGDEFRIRD
jgi:hypothetical protein